MTRNRKIKVVLLIAIFIVISAAAFVSIHYCNANNSEQLTVISRQNIDAEALWRERCNNGIATYILMSPSYKIDSDEKINARFEETFGPIELIFIKADYDQGKTYHRSNWIDFLLEMQNARSRFKKNPRMFTQREINALNVFESINEMVIEYHKELGY